MINYFIGQSKEVMVKGKGSELVVFGRAGKGGSRFKINHVFNGMLEDDTKISDGDTVIDGEDSYFVVALRKSYRSTQAQFYKANATIDIIRLVKHFTGGTQDGFSENLLEISPTLQETVSVGLRQYDAGLLPNTIKRFLLPKINIQLMDRIKLEGQNFQVDSIDDTTFSGLLSIQCSSDKRVTK